MIGIAIGFCVGLMLLLFGTIPRAIGNIAGQIVQRLETKRPP